MNGFLNRAEAFPNQPTPFKENGNAPHKLGLHKEESAQVIPPNFEPRSQRQFIAPNPLAISKIFRYVVTPHKSSSAGTVHEINQCILADMMAVIRFKRPLPQNPWLTISQSQLLNIHPCFIAPTLPSRHSEIRIVLQYSVILYEKIYELNLSDQQMNGFLNRAQAFPNQPTSIQRKWKCAPQTGAIQRGKLPGDSA
ncbi:hypothetical protein CEXT_743311 [Caerostris extrusa]|uniref:Uncharacterized protein n=1 Tax=Caerostris extrusa TaxID=172846 RepID=A0AAV4VTL1_CAEEX|nr:hypothetical protein CEXT_743311 [Caerostris extrusa]